MAKTWYCYNKACRAPLGQVVRSELTLRPGDPNLGAISTDNTKLVVQCAKCGRPNLWVPHDSKIVKDFFGTHLIRALIESAKQMWTESLHPPEWDDDEDDGD